ncbi:MAG TPA: malate synthase [Clostridiales bacterium]|nr:malate synthase [Clostridiales bacterium]
MRKPLNLINKQVIHKSFGKGSIINQTDTCIEISFKTGRKKFIFPDAFDGFLTLIDEHAAESVEKVIQHMEHERKQQELAFEEEYARQRREEQLIVLRERLLRNHKRHPKSQAAFWCKSDDIDKIFTDWRVFTGVIKSGMNEGKPNKPVRLGKTSACLLTAREPRTSEKQRRIIGAFMVDDHFVGQLCEDGYIPSNPEYRLRLTDEESKKMLFWNYYINEKYPDRTTWNTGVYRYFDNVWMAQILRDIVSIKEDPGEKELARDFFEHFCKVNHINENELPEPGGTLKRL